METKLNDNRPPDSSDIITNVQITIDTELLISKYFTPSIVPARPTWIGYDPEYMVVSNQTLIDGQGNGELKLSASIGDVVCIYGTSKYHNMDSSILIYNIAKLGGEDVFGPFVPRKYVEEPAPTPDSTQKLPSTFKQLGFWFYETSIQKAGTEKWKVSFALYIRVKGQVDPVLYGYFYWDPTVVVKE